MKHSLCRIGRALRATAFASVLALAVSARAGEPCPALGDMDDSGTLTGADIQPFVDCLLGGAGDCACADMNADGSVSPADVPIFVNYMLFGPPNQPINRMRVNVQISPPMVAGPVNRCVIFDLYQGGVLRQRVGVQIDFLSGLASDVVVTIPPGTYDRVCAYDPRHTLQATDDSTRTFRIVGQEYVADFTGNPTSGGNWLWNGNLNRDRFIDVLDQSSVNSRIGTDYGPNGGNTDCLPSGIHADLDGDGMVTAADLSIVSNNLFKRDATACGNR